MTKFLIYSIYTTNNFMHYPLYVSDPIKSYWIMQFSSKIENNSPRTQLRIT